MVVRRPRVLTLSEKESLILELLSHGDQMYGLQLVAAWTGGARLLMPEFAR